MAIFVIAFMLVFSSWDHGQNDLIGPIPPKPDYSDSSMWYIRDRGGDADIFYVISTETGDHMIGNDTCHFADVRDSYLRGRMEHEMHAVDSFYSGRLNYFSPYYRQASMQSWATEELAMSRIPLPMKDCVESFQYYIEHFNQSRPFILAGFSQGSYALVEIMKQMPDSIAKRMVAAYCIGYHVTAEEMARYPEQLCPAHDSTEVGKLIIFNSITDTTAIGMVSRGDVAGVIPTVWSAVTDTIPADYQLGMAKYNDSRDSVLIVPCPTRTYVYKHNTVCPDLDPEMVFIPAYEDMFPRGNLHFADSWLFAGNVKQNMACRLRNWKAKN